MFLQGKAPVASLTLLLAAGVLSLGGCTIVTPNGTSISPAPQFMSFVGCVVGGWMAAAGKGVGEIMSVTIPAAMPETAKNVVQIIPSAANRLMGASNEQPSQK